MTQTQTQPLVLASRSPSGRVLILTMNRPESLNALSGALFKELNAHLVSAVHDDSVACVVLTGGEKVFAAGADIKEMKRKDCECPMLVSWVEGHATVWRGARVCRLDDLHACGRGNRQPAMMGSLSKIPQVISSSMTWAYISVRCHLAPTLNLS